MSDVLVVLMGDELAGEVRRLRNGRLRFDYDAAYQRLAGATPLSLSMPLQVRSHSDRVVAPWLWGLLPDNDAVLSRWSRQFHASSSPFSLLSTPIGEDCAGAVRFAAPDRLDAVRARAGRVKWLRTEDVAERLRELEADNTAWLGNSFTGQFSLAGTQAKTALLYERGRWGVPSGSAATSHILKPAIAGLDDHDLNEHLCLDAASRVGLVVARTRVERFADVTAVVVDRYDRTRLNGRLTRVHQEDLCQALAIPPSRKYQAEGGPSARDIVGLFRRSMPRAAAEDATWRFVDALAWNWLIAGTDAHAKNYSLLLAGDQVRLAPLYDIASALPYKTAIQRLKLAMSLGGEYRLRAHRASTWPRTARDLDLDSETVVTRVHKLAEAAPSAFRDAADALGDSASVSDLPARLVDAISRRAAECARLLAAPRHVTRA